MGLRGHCRHCAGERGRFNQGNQTSVQKAAGAPAPSRVSRALSHTPSRVNRAPNHTSSRERSHTPKDSPDPCVGARGSHDQKKCHPDIAGEDEGTKMSRLLNKIYDTLMHDGARAPYDEAAGVTFREFSSGGRRTTCRATRVGRSPSGAVRFARLISLEWSGVSSTQRWWSRHGGCTAAHRAGALTRGSCCRAGSKNGGLFVNESVCIGASADAYRPSPCWSTYPYSVWVSMPLVEHIQVVRRAHSTHPTHFSSTRIPVRRVCSTSGRIARRTSKRRGR